ncbi:MAG TPA: hypothetical protein VF898_11415 [Chloroflexota bacterium]
MKIGLMLLALAGLLGLSACGRSQARISPPHARPLAGRSQHVPTHHLAVVAKPRRKVKTHSTRAHHVKTAGHAPNLEGPLPGMLLIADKDNNRLLLVDQQKRIIWQYPHAGVSTTAGPFLIPDDAFFTPSGNAIIATEEDYHVIREIDVPTGKVIWQYGQPGVPGSGPGYLNGPDDAYWVKGLVTVADIRNCRILVLNGKEQVVRQYGRTGVCAHDPPRAFDAPNGDTPLPQGSMLVSEISGSWVDRLDARGRLVWAMHTPLAYPSDPQMLSNGHILVSDYTLPGRVVELDPKGRIVASFGADAGPNLLNHPSLAIPLPHGLVALNDDWNHRVIIVNMRTQRILWQYGTTGTYGSGPGLLNNPDGIDFLPNTVVGERVMKLLRSRGG